MQYIGGTFRTVAANVERDFIQIIAMELVNKNIIVCVGNLNSIVAEEDLFKLFGIRQVVTSKKQVKLIYLCTPKRVILG